MLDDELDLMLAEFPPGVRVLVLSDSCHSGTVTRDARDEKLIAGLDPAEAKAIYGTEKPTFRYMPRNVAIEVYSMNSEFYDGVQRPIPTEKPEVAASVVLISGCRDDQLSGEAWGHGLFTQALLDTWKQGAFEHGYERFQQEILKLMPRRQQPELFKTGVENAGFLGQKPFTI